MSGTGESAALTELAAEDFGSWTPTTGGYSEEKPCADAGGRQQLWREDRSKRCSTDTTTERVARRETNAFGKRDAERDRILDDLTKVEPLLRAGSTAEIDTRAPLDEVVEALERIGGHRAPPH
jgi:hypothetical protein